MGGQPSPRGSTCYPFQHERAALAAADAEGREGEGLVRDGELGGGGEEEARAGGADRVAEGDRAAVRVEPGGVDLTECLREAELLRGERVAREGLEAGEHLRREGLVDLDHVHVGERAAGLAQGS